MTEGWEFFPHGIDIGVRARGGSKARAFEQAALALTALWVDPARVRLSDTVEILCAATDDEMLLVAWLNAVLTEMSAQRMLFGAFSVTLEAGQLRARAQGEAMSAQRHGAGVEVRAAGYAALEVAPEAEGWRAQTVLGV